MSVIASKKVITRKPHKCWGCAREFPKGSTLDRVTCTDGEVIMSAYWCEICQEWLTEYDDGEGVEFGTLRGDEDWEKIKQEMSISPAPKPKGD